MVYPIVYLSTRPLYPILLQWSEAATWDPLPWYTPPAPGTFRAWIERSRPRLHRFGAQMVTRYFLWALRHFLVVVAVSAIVLLFL